jgi:hypothetical protein
VIHTNRVHAVSGQSESTRSEPEGSPWLSFPDDGPKSDS